jgi:hypothetical protein
MQGGLALRVFHLNLYSHLQEQPNNRRMAHLRICVLGLRVHGLWFMVYGFWCRGKG